MTQNEKEVLGKIIQDMRESAEFNRTPYGRLPPEYRVSGVYCGEAVVTRQAVADRIEGWATRLNALLVGDIV